MKKTALVFLGGMLVAGGLAHYFGLLTNETTYSNETEERVIDNTPEWALDEEAKAAAEAVIQKKAWEAELETVNLEINGLETRKVELEKNLGTYWSDVSNIKAYIREVFPNNPSMAINIAYRESGLRMVQSNYTYTNNVPKGHSAGQREQSFCVFQIHKPAHHANAVRLGLDDYATNVESCVKMAKVIYDNSGWRAWSVYKDILAMR